MQFVTGVIDASVLLAAILHEIDAKDGARWIMRSCISTVNLSEVVAKLTERGFPEDLVAVAIKAFDLDIRPFDADQAWRAGMLRESTRELGLSFADRACLALAAEAARPAITADRAWAKLDIGIKVEVIR